MDMTNIRTGLIIAASLIFGLPAPISAQQTRIRTDAQAYIDSTLQQEWIREASAGILALKMSGDTVAYMCGDKLMIPASTMKAVTTGAALHSLGPDYRFETRIGYCGEILDGTLHGDLYIMGGADPTLGSRNHIAEPVEVTFGKWMSMLSKAGISRIEGHIVGDSRFFDNVAEIGSWQWEDIGTYYGTGVCGLSFNENMRNINVSPGEAPGRPLKISPGYPDMPWMEYRFPCVTGQAGTANTLYMYTSAFAPAGEMRGSFPIDRKTKTEQVSNKFPAYTCAWHFGRYLEKHGITCTEGPADLGKIFGMKEKEAAPQEMITVLGSTFSPELSVIVSETNHESNNMYAETLFKTLGKEYTGEGTYEAAAEAVEGILTELGADPSEGFHQADGSGLSRMDSVSPAFLCRFLGAMMSSPAFMAYSESLPRPGGTGTLIYVMGRYPSGTKARIRMKSGSMTGVKCYCGYIIPTEGSRDDTIVFAVMVNNYFGKQYPLQTFLEKAIILMAEEN